MTYKEEIVDSMSDRSKNDNANQNMDDPLMMQTSNSPGMTLVTVLLTDNNFLTWSKSIKRAFATKIKLGFINGSLIEPTTEPQRSKWRRVDEIVSSWIINSMVKEIVETFVYSISARKLTLD